MAKKNKSIDYPFYEALLSFYKSSKKEIWKFYKPETRKILNYNDKEKREDAFLRKPQYEALEIYVMIKELLNNAQMFSIFADWYNKKRAFTNRVPFSTKQDGQLSIFDFMMDDITKESYEQLFDKLKAQGQSYPNYIYALTMGTGKTILMATCIFYEFILAHKYPDDLLYCHNALVFAPDKTVLQSLREIQTFDFKKVIPNDYVNFLTSNLKFHVLDDASTSLNTIDGSDFNIIISNTQKIILKEKHKEKSATDKLMNMSLFDYGLDSETQDIYSFLENEVEDEREVEVNQRFQKIIRLKQLGVYVDEAHHMFGKELSASLNDTTNESSLRYTINKVADVLEKSSTKLVACYNFTGTPYVENSVLPEVVYSYGLKTAIDNEYLKQVQINGYDNVKNEEFLRRVLEDFFLSYEDNLYEGLKPKIAIYGATVDEVVNEIQPLVEGILNDLGIPLDTILVNVGDQKYTKDADIKNFNNLDVVGTEGSLKQVILLVNKGKEGWNCRSLFSVALFRSPKSKVFVLQSTMRCLRSITEIQQKARVYLSKDNFNILDEELQKNFNLNIATVNSSGTTLKTEYLVKIVEPVITLNLSEIKKTYNIRRRSVDLTHYSIDLSKIDLEKYKSTKTVKEGLDTRQRLKVEEFVSETNHKYSKYQIIYEVARYLNEYGNVLDVEELLENTSNFDDIVDLVSKYNGVLYDELIPSIFNYLYWIEEKVEKEDKHVPLIKYPNGADHFTFRSTEDLTIQKDENLVKTHYSKSFHTDRYCFDSKPEEQLFLDLIADKNVDKIYFTGMFTGKENGLSVQYIDPESNVIRTYYPDFLVYYKDGSIDVIEVKGDNMIDSKEVQAKAEAMLETALYSDKMDYKIIKSSDIMHNRYRDGDKIKRPEDLFSKE